MPKCELTDEYLESVLVIVDNLVQLQSECIQNGGTVEMKVHYGCVGDPLHFNSVDVRAPWEAFGSGGNVDKRLKFEAAMKKALEYAKNRGDAMPRLKDGCPGGGYPFFQVTAVCKRTGRIISTGSTKPIASP